MERITISREKSICAIRGAQKVSKVRVLYYPISRNKNHDLPIWWKQKWWPPIELWWIWMDPFCPNLRAWKYHMVTQIHPIKDDYMPCICRQCTVELTFWLLRYCNYDATVTWFNYLYVYLSQINSLESYSFHAFWRYHLCPVSCKTIWVVLQMNRWI